MQLAQSTILGPGTVEVGGAGGGFEPPADGDGALAVAFAGGIAGALGVARPMSTA